MPNTDICPVCSMRVKFDTYVMEYHKMTFHFCSEQCQTNFSAHPSLYPKLLPDHPHDPILKHRTLHLATLVSSEQAATISAHLQSLMGMQHVAINDDKLQLEYDLLQVTEVQVEQALNEIGVKLGEGWVERLRRAWIHERETNELDNLAAPPRPCCNRAPPGT